MSIQATVFRTILRRAVKPNIKAIADASRALPTGFVLGPGRQMLNDLAYRFVGMMPRDGHIEDVSAGGVPAEWITVKESQDDRVLLYLHGGAYIFGGPDTHRGLVHRLAARSGARGLVLDYRLAPEHPFPAPVDDAYAAYCWLIDQGFEPNKIIVAGDSAGGGLTFALTSRLKAEGVPMPGALATISPWTDLAVTGQSMKTNRRADPMFDAKAIPVAAEMYLSGADPKHPEASPLYADVEGFPPTLIHVGSTELLLDDARRMEEKLTAANVDVSIEVWHDMPHVWHVFADRLPEGKQAIAKMGQFMAKHLNHAAIRDVRKPVQKAPAPKVESLAAARRRKPSAGPRSRARAAFVAAE